MCVGCGGERGAARYTKRAGKRAGKGRQRVGLAAVRGRPSLVPFVPVWGVLCGKRVAGAGGSCPEGLCVW